MPSQKEVIIIGAGVIGCSIAYHLARRGIPSQIIERDGIAARASGKALATIPYPPDFFQFESFPPEHLWSMPEGSFEPFMQIFWEGYERLPDMALELKEDFNVNIGFGELAWTYIVLTDAEEELLRKMLALHKSRGYHDSWWMEEKDLKNSYPDISPKARGGLVVPNLQVEPYRYTLGLAQAAEKRGANFRQGEAVGFKTRGSKVTSVKLATGTEVEGDAFVLTMGPWNKLSTSWLGKELPAVINQDELLRLQPPKELPPIALTASGGAAGLCIMPQVDGSVILTDGGIPELTLRPDYDSSLKEENKIRIMENALELMPSLGEAKLIEHRGDILHWGPAPYHWRPVLGRLPDWNNAYVVLRVPLGITSSLGIGRCMADVIIGEDKASYRYKNLMEFVSPANG